MTPEEETEFKRRQKSRNLVVGGIHVSYTHLTLPTIYSV